MQQQEEERRRTAMKDETKGLVQNGLEAQAEVRRGGGSKTKEISMKGGTSHEGGDRGKCECVLGGVKKLARYNLVFFFLFIQLLMFLYTHMMYIIKINKGYLKTNYHTSVPPRSRRPTIHL